MTFQFTLHSLFSADDLDNGHLSAVVPAVSAVSADSTNDGVDGMMTESFTWTVEDTETVDAIHSAPNVFGFWSPIVEMHGFKWFLALYPNGSRLARKGSANLYLTLASVPRADIEVHVMATLSFYDHFDDVIFRHNLESAGRSGSMLSVYSTEDLHRFNRFYFTAKVTMIEVHGNESNAPWNGSEGNRGVNVVEVETAEFVWNLPPIRIEGAVSTEFELHGFEWMAMMNEEGEFRLRLLWNEEMDIDVVSIRCFVEFVELQTRYTMKGVFTVDHEERSWGNDRISIDDFHALQTRTIRVQMDLIDMFKDGGTRMYELL